MLTDPYDAAIFVQDYPPPELDESKPFYLSDAKSFIEASSKVRIPSAICSTLPENMDQSTREMLVENGVAPMQGIHEALEAISSSVWYFGRREAIRKNGIEKFSIKLFPKISGVGNVFTLVDEWEGKQLLQKIGLNVPEGRIAESAEVPEIAEKIRLSVSTVKSDLRSLYSKLQVSTRTEAVAVVVQKGLARKE
jgi:acyl-CoA synthetase (NDP forming)